MFHNSYSLNLLTVSTDCNKPYIYLRFNRLQWHPLLEPSIPTLSSNTACPRETQLLMERKRLSTWGITEYELHKKSGRIIFPAIGTLYQCIDTGYSVTLHLFAKCFLEINFKILI